MGKIDKIFSKIDKKVDRNFFGVKNFFKNNFQFISTLFIFLLVMTLVLRLFYSRPQMVASIIEDDINQITLMLKRIDVKCNILSINKDRSDVDFLNIKSFSGSQVGPLNLAYPDKWEGPYLRVNPSIKGKYYEIVKVKDGIFVIPGRGVKLPNGLTIGKDFDISKENVMSFFVKAGGMLTYRGRRFAKPITFKIGDWDPWIFRDKNIRDLDRIIRELDEAMPYTSNDNSISFSSQPLRLTAGTEKDRHWKELHREEIRIS